MHGFARRSPRRRQLRFSWLVAALGLVFLASLATPLRADETKAKKKSKREALNKAFRGRIVQIKKRRVTLFYDFEDEEQLKDFEEARPPRLLDASSNRVRIAGGRLHLEGSSSLRHRMEGKKRLNAHFFARISQQGNVGTVFTEPVLSDFFVVLNLFDRRFYRNGGLILCSCGLHEDEGADTDMALVNWRDIFRGNVKNKAKVGADIEIEVAKDGWMEYCRVEDVEGKGSSKGKTTKMDAYQFGFWVHQMSASFDDLTLTIEPTDEFLDLNNLRAEISEDWLEVPESGPFAGIGGVNPRLRKQAEDYAKGVGDERQIVRMLKTKSLAKKAREVAARLLKERRNPKVVPKVIDVLYNEDKFARKLAISVVKAITGKTFGYSPSSSEKKRSAAIRKLNAFLAQNRTRYFG